jgi:hypothetical protein
MGGCTQYESSSTEVSCHSDDVILAQQALCWCRAGACIPLMMLALGATFADGPGAGSTLPKRAVVAVAVVRLLLLPLAGALLVP